MKTHGGWAGTSGARRLAAALALPALVGGCATAGSTLGSGVPDRLLEHPPFYAGARPGGDERVLVLPIAYQRGGAQEPMFDPAGGKHTPVAALLDEMNAYLATLAAAGLAIAADDQPGGVAPDVYFGCERDALGECAGESEDVSVAGAPWMRLAVGRPSRGWVESAGAALREADADHVLVITLEVGQHWPHQKNWRGSKEVRLGTDHSVDLPWLTALDRPVQVLQLTGALVDAEGRAVRIGAEGLLAQRTGILLAGLGVQELIGDEDVERVRGARREDLPGGPLVWQVALRNLVAQLTGQPVLAAR